jgi:hypothetical protein
MITLLGVLLVITLIASFVWEKMKNEFDERDLVNEKYNEKMVAEGQSERYFKPIKNFPSFPIRMRKRYLAILAVMVFMVNGLFFWNNSGTITSVQYPWGGDKMIATQGLKVKAWGKTIPISYEISIQDKILKKNAQGEVIESIPESSDGIYNRVAKKWEFSDAIKADIATAIVIEIVTEDEEAFLNMADRNRSEAKLIYGRVLPNIDAALKNTCKLMDAQDYISGAASDFDRYFRDQLENGMYQVEEYYDDDANPEIIGDTTTVRTVDNNNGASSKQKKYRIKEDEQGNIIRDNSSNSLSQYGIRFIQAQVTSIDWEGSFDTRLDRQKEEVALTQLEKQAAERLYYTTQKEIALGESNKATERALLEKEQIKLTIAAETEAKVAVQNRIAEVEKLEVAKLQAMSKKVAADATYYENAKRVQAGLTPQERQKMDEQMNRDKWENIGKMKFDGVYMMGGTQSKGGDGLLSALLGAEVAKKMNTKK